MYRIIKTLEGRIIEDMIQRISDNAFIPRNPVNRDYQEYLQWLKEGGLPIPADQPSTDNS
jgi:hypothetical protein